MNAINFIDPFSGTNIILTGSFDLFSTVSLITQGDYTITSEEGSTYTIKRGADVTGQLLRVPSTSTLTISNAVIDGNGIRADENGYLGLILNYGDLTLNRGAVLQNNNVAMFERGTGGAITNYGNLRMNSGSVIRNNYCWMSAGAILNEGSGTFRLSGVEISGNYGDASGITTTSNTENTIENCTFFNNSADYGGVIEMTDGVLNMSGSEISENSGSETILINEGAAFNLMNTSIKNNEALYNGGGLTNRGTTNITDCEISFNTSENAGGVMNLSTGVLTISGSEISNNSVTQNGGGIWNAENGVVTINNSTISSNTAAVDGGGIVADGKTTTLRNSAIYGNSAVRNGGGLIDYNDISIDEKTQITNNNAGSDGGGIYLSSDSLILNGQGQVTGNTAGRDGGGVYIAGGELDLTYQAQISGNTALNDGGGIYLSGGKLFAGSGQITNNTAVGNGGGIGTSYDNLINLSVDQYVTFSGNRASQAYQIATEDIALHEATIKTNSFSSGFEYGYNNFDISYTKGTPYTTNAVITATKTAQGAALPEGQFDFGLFNSSGAMVATASNVGGVITFPAQSFTGLQAGTHNYTIREITPSGNHWTVDGSSYPAAVTVSIDPGTGLPTASVSYPGGGANFVNTYNPDPTSADIVAYKVFNNWDSEEKTFYFVLDDGFYEEITENVGGVITFPNHSYEETGEYHYTVSEYSRSGSGWIVDGRTYPVTVIVTDSGGQLISEVTYPEGRPVFENTYAPTPASAVITAHKTLNNWPLEEEKAFEFGLYDAAGQLVETAQNSGGVVTFPQLQYNLPGTFNYTVRELTPLGSGWITDESIFPATVTVTDENGILRSEVNYPEGEPSFVNTYYARPITLGLYANKEVTGAELPAGAFSFGIFDESGNEIASGVNDADGQISFSRFTIETAGTYNYTFRETTPSGGGWTTDSTVFPMELLIYDIGAGRLIARPMYPEGYPTFVNTFQPSPSSVTPQAKKTAAGKTLTAGQFEFGLFNVSGENVSVAANDADGNVIFPALTFDAAGTYYYTIRELTPSGGGWTTDSSSYPAVVTVSLDPATGQLSAAIDYPSGEPSFVNTYSSSPGFADITAYKVLENWDSQEKVFDFGLYDAGGQLVQLAQNSGGVIDFPQLHYDAPGEYSYTVREITASGGGWTTDSSSYPVLVTVVNEDGELISEVTYPEGQPTFYNTYSPGPGPGAARLSLTANKQATGAALSLGAFDFGVFDENGNRVSLATNDENGSINFPDLSFGHVGTYNYTIRELTPSGDGWTTDSRQIPATITVSDTGEKDLTATVFYPEEPPIFYNSYLIPPIPPVTPAVARIHAVKHIIDCCLREGVFSFGLFDSTGKLVAQASNDAAGDVRFSLTFDTAGQYSYTMRELKTSARGWRLDTREYPVSVAVADVGGKLAALVDYPNGIPVFVNLRCPCHR
jgi:pilin isopeptide linkage protein